MRLQKYLSIINASWQRQLTFRLDFLGYRIGSIIEISVQLLVWSVIFSKVEIVNGYTYQQMLTYVLLGWLFYLATYNYNIESVVSEHIKKGELSNFLTKPISYLRYIVAYSLGRISIAVISGIFLMFIFMFIFRNNLIFPSTWQSVVVILSMLILAYFIRLLLSVLIGFMSFWTTEINGIYYGINILIRFLSGFYFPLDLLPKTYLKISNYFPFMYNFFAPTQIYLGRATLEQWLTGLINEIIWLFLLYAIIKIVWRIGLKKYEGVGI